MTPACSPTWSCPSHVPAPKLFLFGLDGGGLLKLTLQDDLTIAVRLYGRHVRILLALNEALQLDKDLDEAVRGWMTKEQLAEAYGCGDPLMLPPTPEAIAAYRSQINKLVRQETPVGLAPPGLFDSQRCVGIRLAQEITVIDLSQRCQSGPD